MNTIDQNKINVVLKTVFENLSKITDLNTVIGKSIVLDDSTTVIPISKVTLGILSGGGEYGEKGIFSCNKNLPFSAGNGSVISLKPYGFLVKEKDKSVKLISTEKESFEKIIDLASDCLEKFNK